DMDVDVLEDAEHRAFLVGADDVGQLSAEEIIAQRRMLAVAGEELSRRSGQLVIGGGLEERRARLLVEAAAHGEENGPPEVLIRVDADVAAGDAPGVGVAAQVERAGGANAGQCELELQECGAAVADLGHAFLRVDLEYADPSVGVRLETLRDLAEDAELHRH